MYMILCSGPFIHSKKKIPLQGPVHCAATKMNVLRLVALGTLEAGALSMFVCPFCSVLWCLGHSDFPNQV